MRAPIAANRFGTPGSLAQGPGLTLGVQAGKARLKEVVVDRGFKRFRRGAETPLSMVLGETAAGGNHVRARSCRGEDKI